MGISKILFEDAIDLSSKMNAKAILISYEAFANVINEIGNREIQCNIYLIAKSPNIPEDIKSIVTNVLNVPDIPFSRMGQIKVALIVATSAHLLHKNDIIICLTSPPASQVLDTLLIFEVGEEFELLSSPDIADLTKNITPQVFQGVLQLALEIAREGREGKPVGTIFILGDTNAVMKHTHQLILNPFKGHPEKKKQILDPTVQETIKELSTIDGAFIIKPSGVILTCGAFLETKLITEDLPQGLGTRHYTAAAITAVTKALAITVSESTGQIRIFKNGKIITEIEKPQ